MIFVTLGSQKFQFNRLLQKLDELTSNGIILDQIYAQTGYSDYLPKNYEFQHFMSREAFAKAMYNCDIVITHGGTGAIIGAVKAGKKVIAVPRLKAFREHVDDHQIQLLRQFEEMNILLPCWNITDLPSVYEKIQQMDFNRYISNTEKIIRSIEIFLDK